MPVGATPEVRTYTPLHEAVYFGNAAKVQSILSSGEVKVDARTERKETPLHYALCHNKVNCIPIIVKAGAKLNKRTLNGDTPLIMGVMMSPIATFKEFIKVCKDEGANLDFNKPNFFGETPLHFAATHNHEEHVKALLESGADVNATTLTGHTALHIAREEGFSNIVTLLLSHAAEERAVPVKGTPPRGNLPVYIRQGYLHEKNMQSHEMDFGGALFLNCLPVFFMGKKPKDGLCVEIAVVFTKSINGLMFTRLRGMIFHVSDDKKKVKAVVILNCDHEGVIKRLAGEWEATLMFFSGLQFPWILTDLVKLPVNSDHSYARVLEISKQLDKQRGRKFVVQNQQAQKEAQRCMIPKGLPVADGEDPLIVTEVILHSQSMEVVVKFENGPDQLLKGDMAVLFAQNIIKTKQANPAMQTIINFL